MSGLELLVVELCVAGLVVGVLIGYAGIGGVLLAPALNVVAGIPIHEAIALAMFTYPFAGIAGSIMYGTRGSIPWRLAGIVGITAGAGALAGALLLPAIPGRVVQYLVAGAIILASLQTLRPARLADTAVHSIRKRYLTVAGIMTGCGSAMTGTGGPLILLPIALTAGLALRTAVGLSQFVQIPIGTFATIGNLSVRAMPLGIGFLLAVTVAAGVVVGGWIMHRVPGERARVALGIVVLCIGVAYAANGFRHVVTM